MNHIPYILNIIILLPAIVLVLQGKIDVFPQQQDMEVPRMMVASLWLGVLMVSVLALLDPVEFWPVLAFQVIYNAIFGAFWVWPSLMGRSKAAVPWGAVAIFAIMIIAWPFFIAAAWQSGQS